MGTLIEFDPRIAPALSMNDTFESVRCSVMDQRRHSVVRIMNRPFDQVIAMDVRARVVRDLIFKTEEILRINRDLLQSNVRAAEQSSVRSLITFFEQQLEDLKTL